MGYPPVIAPLKPKEGREFAKRVSSFKLDKDQQGFWSDPSRTTVSPKSKA